MTTKVNNLFENYSFVLNLHVFIILLYKSTQSIVYYCYDKCGGEIMYIIFSVIFLISFFTGILITMSDDKEKNVVEQKNKSSIQNDKPYAIVDNEII